MKYLILVLMICLLSGCGPELGIAKEPEQTRIVAVGPEFSINFNHGCRIVKDTETNIEYMLCFGAFGESTVSIQKL